MNCSAAKTAFRDEIAASSFAGRVQFHFDDGDAAQKLQLALALGAPDAGTHVYVCGPTGFMDHVLETARSLGWAEERLHREYFAATPIDHSADGPFELEIKGTGQVSA